MIGQEHIQVKVNLMKSLPRFIILSATKGMGKLTLCKLLATKFNKQLIVSENKIDDIRNIIAVSNEINSDVLIVIRDANKMSTAAANSLLKISEEAPNNIHLVICVDNHSLVLPTLLSRGQLFIFKEYSNAEKQQYIKDKSIVLENEYLNYYETLEQLELVKEKEIIELINLVRKIVTSIDTTNGANAFNILKSISIKDGDEGFEINHFLYALESECYFHMKNTRALDEVTCRILNAVRTARNKVNSNFKLDFVMDKFILDMKGV